MKQYISIVIIFAVLLLLIPSIALLKSPETNIVPETSSLAEAITSEVINNIPKINSFKVLDTVTGQVLTLSAKEYLIGAVMAEMPAYFHEEALKAQVVAAHTYAIKQSEFEQAAKTPELMGADFSNDSQKYQAYFTKEQAIAFYGTDYEKNLEKISKAVEQVESEILTFNNEPIVAAFHSMSGGITESAAVIWGADVQYLVPAKSESDINAPSFIEEKKFTKDEISARLTSVYPDIILGENFSDWLKVTDRTSSGTVTAITCGNKTLTGMDVRTCLSLRSANFTTALDGETFIITTKGYGHGVGLSQYGANSMANEGKTYKDILTHYYSGVEISYLEN